MKTIFAALVATVAFAGAAAAQQAPVLHGNYSANVLQEYNGNSVQYGGRHSVTRPAPDLDLMSTGSIRSERTVPGNFSANITDYEIRGR